MKNFEQLAKRLLNDDPLRKTVTGWDTKTEQIVKRDVVVSVVMPTSMKIELVVRKLAISTVRYGDGYVLATDVLANSLNYLFMHRDQSELYEPLNRPEAIVNHPIAQHLAAFYDWGTGDLIGDRLYRHPKGHIPQ